MHQANHARSRQIAVARAVVRRADGSRQTFYSYERPKSPRQALKLWRHLRRMKKEDRNGS